MMKQTKNNRRCIGKTSPAERILTAFLASYAALLCALGLVDYVCPDVISVYGTNLTDTEAGVYCLNETAELTLGGVLPLKTVTVHAYEETVLYPGGMLFGVRCATEGVLVVGLEDVKTASSETICPAKEAGIHKGDIISAVDGQTVQSVKALSDAIAADGSTGRRVSLSVIRGGETIELTLMPCKAADGVYRAGIWTRDATAGIGTVTFIDPETGLFGGLGHGICDAETGTLLPLGRGTTLGVSVGEIIPGAAGKPGEVRGSFSPTRTGTLLHNTGCGVFGVFSSAADMVADTRYDEPIPIGHRTEVETGDAEILCTLDDGAPCAYTVRIISIGDPADMSNKNFMLEVTDEMLLEKTGGIIQGMSGSPIIQNGKLIGAVTHVLVNQPQRGYGIFIENMLAAAG